jgi:hypothetical protein
MVSAVLYIFLRRGPGFNTLTASSRLATVRIKPLPNGDYLPVHDVIISKGYPFKYAGVLLVIAIVLYG